MADATVIAFQADLKAFSEALGLTMATCVRHVTLQVHEGCVLKTPVDTGRARGSWGISLYTPGTYELPEGDIWGVDGGTAMARAQQHVLGQIDEEQPFLETWVYNNLEYIEALENGHSQQAPAGMVAITMAEVEAEIDATLERIAQQTLPKS